MLRILGELLRAGGAPAALYLDRLKKMPYPKLSPGGNVTVDD